MSDRESPFVAAGASTGELVSEAPPEFAFDALDLADLEPLPPPEGEAESLGERPASAGRYETVEPSADRESHSPQPGAVSPTPDSRPPTPEIVPEAEAPAGLADAPPLTEDSPFDAPPTFDEPAPDSPRAAIIGQTGMSVPPNFGQTGMSVPPNFGQTGMSVPANFGQAEMSAPSQVEPTEIVGDSEVVEELPVPPASLVEAEVESSPDALSDFDAPVETAIPERTDGVPPAAHEGTERTGGVPPAAHESNEVQPQAETDAPAPAVSITPSQALEALLFSSSEPLAPTRLGSLVGDLDAKGVRRLIDELNRHYRETGRAFAVEEVAGGFQLLTRPEFHAWLKKLSKSKGEGKLSQTALLTLSIIAYKQPVKRIDIESVRGTACGEVLRLLMDRGLVKIVGREESLGRPLLYGTTKKFLQVFGLGSLKELPRVEELNKP